MTVTDVSARTAFARWAPNVITAVRLATTVPLTRRIRRGDTGPSTAALVALWGGTDWVDGALARGSHRVSALGTALDPVADRLGIAALTWSLATVGALPRPVPAVVLTVDTLVVLAAGRAATRGKLKVSRLGKVRSAVLFVTLVAASATVPGQASARSVVHGMAWAGTVLHVAAGVSYVRSARGH